MLEGSCSVCTVQSPESFSPLSPLALRDFRSLGACRRYPPNDVLIHDGLPSDHVFVVCSGRIRIVVSSPHGRFLALRVVGPGEILGLTSLIQGPAYHVSAETLVPSTVKSILRSDFIRFMQTYAEVTRDISRAMARDYSGATLSPQRLTLNTPRLTLPLPHSSDSRLASALLDAARTHHLPNLRPPPDQPITFPMPLTHEQLGATIGLSRQTVTRLLLKFRREGLIELDRERMTLNRPDILQSRYCSGTSDLVAALDHRDLSPPVSPAISMQN